MVRNTDGYKDISAEETLKALNVGKDIGLTEEEVQKRLDEYGYNEIQEKDEPLWHRIMRRFWGPIPWMIEAAAVLSAIVQKWEDFAIITIMLLVNASLDFFQERRALNALKALKTQLTTEVPALRGGAFRKVPVRELVPGDIVRLRSGAIVPADVQLIEGDYLLIDQASLTGESLPVSRKVSEVAYANTAVKQGEMLAVVVNTGPNTNFHTVVALVVKAGREEVSHFQKMVIKIGDFLIAVTLGLIAIIVVVALFREENMLEIVRFALVLAVAAIPVALPAVLSVTMAVGAMNLAKRKAIVSKLTAIEELAGVDIFCSDKTGTLTKNEMTVADPVALSGHGEEDLFLVAALASRLDNQDPLEMAIYRYIDENLPSLDWKSYTQKHFEPFDPVRKYTDADVEKGDESFKAVKGAAQVLIGMADLSEKKARELKRMVDEQASGGYRTIAVGRSRGDGPLELIGLIPMLDPPRDDSAETIKDMRDYGVEVKMITGDNIAIAREIGTKLGLEMKAIRSSETSGRAGSQIMELASVLTEAIYQRLYPDVSKKEAERFAEGVIENVREMFDTSVIEKEFVHTHESSIIETISKVDIFAEVVPEDKYRIVAAMQKAGHIVGMTGDGVNDAPALKKADCGIAVSNATDAARAAADIILTSPGLGVINKAIKQARITFERMKSYSIYRIAETIRIILFMTLSIVVFNFYPITALMIIILALLNDIPILAIAYDNTRVYKRPVRWNMAEMLTVSTILGVAGVIASFTLYFILKKYGLSNDVIQSLIFTKLIVAGHGTIYNTRINTWFWKKPFPSAMLFGASFSTAVLGTLIAVYGVVITPIGWEFAAYMWAYALVWFLFNDAVKVSVYRVMRSRGLLAAASDA